MNTSAAIMLMPTQEDAERLAIEGGEFAHQLHVTLAFMGPAEGWTAEQQGMIHEAVAEAVKHRSPHTAQAFASALFNPGEGQAHVLLISDGPQGEESMLESLHIEAMDCCLSVCDVMPTQHKPFAAHLTLGYDETVSEEDVLARIGAVQFDRIRVAFADEHTDYLLGEEVPMEPVEAEVEQSVAWSGPIVFEEQMTGDHRLFRAGSIEWDESSLPWPFRWQKASLPAHETAVCVGRVDRLFRAASNSKIIMAEGVILTGEKAPLEALDFRNLMENGAAGGVSVDGDSAEFEMVPVADSDYEIERHFTRMRLRALTAVDIPAFQNARINLVDSLESQHGLSRESLAASNTQGARRLLALDGGEGVRPSAGWDSVRLDVCGWRESTPSTPQTASYRLGNYGGSNPRGPHNRSSLQEQTVLQSQPHGSSDSSREHTTVQYGKSVVSAGQLWVWAPIQRDQHEMGKTPSEGWFNLLGSDLQNLSAKSSESALSAPESLDVEVLTASAPVKPPLAWFDNPGLAGPTAPTATSEGQVFGHLALAGTCHIGMGDCTTVPLGNSYAYFHTGEIETEDGTCVNVGHLTMRTGHADMNLAAMAAASHYDNTGMVAADVCVGEDEYGVWFAGAARSTLTDEELREFRSAPFSGDWRKIAGRLELVGALAVNVPGFPVPRTRVLVASGGTQTMIAGITEEASREAKKHKLVNAVRRSALRGLVDGVRRQ